MPVSRDARATTASARCALVCPRGDDDDPAGGGGAQLGEQQVDEEKVADVVDGKLRLDAVGAELERREHDARVGNQHVDALVAALDLLREALHGCERGEIQS